MDYRERLLTDIQCGLVSKYNSEEIKEIVNIVAMKMSNYEISDRCTEVSVIDDENIKILKRYSACLYVEGKSENTIRAYMIELIRFNEWLNKPFAKCRVNDIRCYLAFEMERISNHTAENKRSYISALFQWLLDEEYIEKNPCAKIDPIDYPEKDVNPISDIELDMLRSACKNTRERAIIEFLYSTGVRANELRMMDISDIDLHRGTVKVRYGKGSKERTTYMTDVALKRLSDYLSERKDSSTALFATRNGRITTNYLRRILNNIAERCSVTNIYPHRFRATCATMLADRGMPVQEVQKILGHADVSVTLKYYVRVNSNSIAMSYRRHAA